MGRTTYTAAIGEEICTRLAEGEPLRQICRDEHMPAWRTVYGWMEADTEFAARIARAREMGAEAIGEEILDIIDDGRNDWVERENKRTGEVYAALDEEALGRSKLRAEMRLKLLAKWSPQKYGERVTNDVNLNDATLTPTERESRVKAILASAHKRSLNEPDDGSDLV